MRIAYVSLHWSRTRDSGVGKKISSQVAAWNAMGHAARLFMHATRYEPQTDLIEAERFFYDGPTKVNAEINRSCAAAKMIEAIRAYRPDLIYLRYGIYVYPIHKLMDIAPVVEEINTNDLTQHEGLGIVYSLYNRLTRGILFRRVKGMVAVSRELASDSAFVSYGKPIRVIANGVNLDDFSPLPAPDNPIPRLVFIGHPGYPWHGVDKLVALARELPDIQIDVIGYDQIPNCETLPANLSLHGYLPSRDYLKILAGADVALSSLALHRVQLNEASPLKSRECLALGMPLIVAYNDTDLDKLSPDFLLKIPNAEDNVQTHAREIRDFAYRKRGKRVARDLIASIDQKAKEAERLKFFEETLSK